MPLRKHEPVPEKDMDTASPVNSICEVLREIYWLAHYCGYGRELYEIKLKAREATAMAKAMSRRIGELKGDQQWFGPQAEDFWDRKE